MNFYGKDGIAHSQKTVEWETPQFLFDKLIEEFNFTIDVCASRENAKCERFYTKEVKGLFKSWKNEIVFMNPPYGHGKVRKWIEKAYQESLNNTTVVCLIPSRTDTSYWHDYIIPHAEVRFLRGRVKFSLSNDKSNYIEQLNLFEASTIQYSSDSIDETFAPFPSAVVIFNG